MLGIPTLAILKKNRIINFYNSYFKKIRIIKNYKKKK